jgi:hypothetical protein
VLAFSSFSHLLTLKGNHARNGVKNEHSGDSLCGWPYRRHHRSGNHCHLVPIPGRSHSPAFLQPTVLGEGLFLRGQDLASTEGVQVSLKLTLMYTGVHGLVFIVLGLIAAYFLLLTRKKLNLGLWILLIFVILELGFVGTAFVFAEPVLHELAWSIVLLGNFLAATGMASYLWLRHSNFAMRQ